MAGRVAGGSSASPGGVAAAAAVASASAPAATSAPGARSSVAGAPRAVDFDADVRGFSLSGHGENFLMKNHPCLNFSEQHLPETTTFTSSYLYKTMGFHVSGPDTVLQAS